MRAIIINKRLSLLKACIFSGLAVMCLAANADDTPEYAAVPPVDDCHYAEHPLVRETVVRKTVHYKYRRVTHHRIHARYPVHFANDLSVYFPFSSPSYDDMWPSDGCHCEERGYVVSPLSSDEITNNLLVYGPEYESGAEAAPCDSGSSDE